MTVVVEITDDRHRDPAVREASDNLWHGAGGRGVVHGDADEFAPGKGKIRHLIDRCSDVCRIRVGHGLHDHGMTRTDRYAANPGRDGLPTGNPIHVVKYSRRTATQQRAIQSRSVKRALARGDRVSARTATQREMSDQIEHLPSRSRAVILPRYLTRIRCSHTRDIWHTLRRTQAGSRSRGTPR